MISRRTAIAMVLGALTTAQLVHLQSDFAAIDTAEKLIEEYEHPTVVGIGLFLACGFIASAMAFFRASGWRLAVIVAVGLYVWSVWYPDFLHLVIKYGASTVLSGVFEQARAAGTLGKVLLHHILYPLCFTSVLLATIWDFKAGGND